MTEATHAETPPEALAEIAEILARGYLKMAQRCGKDKPQVADTNTVREGEKPGKNLSISLD